MESPENSEPNTDAAATLSLRPAVEIPSASQDSLATSQLAKTKKEMRAANERVKIRKILEEIKEQQTLSAAKSEELHMKQGRAIGYPPLRRQELETKFINLKGSKIYVFFDEM